MGGSFNNATIHADQRHIVKCMGGLDEFIEQMDYCIGKGRHRVSPVQAMTEIVDGGLLFMGDAQIKDYVESIGFPTAGYDRGQIYDFYRRLMVRDGVRLYNEVKAGKRPAAVIQPGKGGRTAPAPAKPKQKPAAPSKKRTSATNGRKNTPPRNAKGQFVSSKGKASTASNSRKTTRR